MIPVKNYKTVESSEVMMSQLMLPSYSNFGGKIHGGYLLNLLDQIAFACASKFSGSYCVTASVDRVDFLNSIEVGELVTLKSSVNYSGKTSIVVGIRVEAQNIQTGIIKHCNSSYFTMVAKDGHGKSVEVPKLILRDSDEIRRFYKSINRINSRRERENLDEVMDYTSAQSIQFLKEKYDLKIELN